jgi:glutaminyl-peptide cyclotransferase
MNLDPQADAARRVALRLLLTGVALLGLGCSQVPPPPARPVFVPAAFDATNALREAQGLVKISPRDAGTPGAEKAAQHLLARLQDAGLPARLQTFTQPTPKGPMVFRNVIGRKPGTGRGLIILGSHYDTKSGIPGFVGANDSGSSCGALIELARVVAAQPPAGPEIEFVFFDGEECMKAYGPQDGLHGSRHYVEHLVAEGRAARALGFILLDMIGDRDLTVTLPRNGSPALTALVLQAAREENARFKFFLHPFQIGDDHLPFLEAGIPAVNLIDFHFGSAPGRNDYWHTPADTLDKISAESLGIVGRVTLRLLNHLIAAAPPEKI